MEPGKNPYEDRQIGVRRKPDWVGKKCASCAKGFNRVSSQQAPSMLSIMDPTSDNEMKRVHKPNHPKCN